MHEEKSLLAGPIGINSGQLLGTVQDSNSIFAFCFSVFRLSTTHTQGVKKKKNKNVTTITVLYIAQHFLEPSGATVSGWQAQELSSLGQDMDDCSLQSRARAAWELEAWSWT